MNRLGKVFCLVLSAVFMFSGIVVADPGTYDVSVPVPINVNIGAIETMSVISRNISDDVAAAVVFTNPGTTTWTISDQYLDIVYACNHALWGIRMVSDNKTLYAGMYGLPLSEGPNGVYDGSPEDPASPNSDDACSYGGLIDDATKTNPENRAILAWQIFADKSEGPDALVDDSLKGLTAASVPTDAYNWNSPWAAVVDVGNTTGGFPQANFLVDITVDPDGDTDTISYMYMVQGGAGGNGLSFHPAFGPDPTLPDAKPGDGQVAAFLGARFADLSAGDYGTETYVQLIHE